MIYENGASLTKITLKNKWAKEHPGFQKNNVYYQLGSEAHMIIFLFLTSHNRLSYHFFSRFKIGPTDKSACGTGKMMGKHILLGCPTYEALRKLNKAYISSRDVA